jgi:hypothetical protein
MVGCGFRGLGGESLVWMDEELPWIARNKQAGNGQRVDPPLKQGLKLELKPTNSCH